MASYDQRMDTEDLANDDAFVGKLIDRDALDPIFLFDLEQVPEKLIEAEHLHLHGDFDTALGIYCNCLKLYVEKYGELSVEAAIIYKEYGTCLFERAKEFSSSLGGIEAPSPVALKQENASDATATSEEANIEDEDEDDEDDEDMDEDTHDYDTENNHAELVESDLELAMENLDVARSIFEEQIRSMTSKAQTNIYSENSSSTSSSNNNSTNDSMGPATSTLDVSASDIHSLRTKASNIPLEVYQNYLADVYENMGLVAMEEETMDRALSDLSKALEIRERVEKADGRALASTHNNLAMYYSTQNQPSKAIHHYTLAASVFVNRMAARMREAAALTTEMQETMLQPQFGLSKGSRKYLLEINMPTQTKIEEALCSVQLQVDRCMRNITAYCRIREAIAEKISDCEEEIRSGLVEDDDGGEKVRKMIKDVMSTNAEAQASETVGFDNAQKKSEEEVKPVTMLAVKRKKPVVEQPQATVEDEQDEIDAKKTKVQ